MATRHDFGRRIGEVVYFARGEVSGVIKIGSTQNLARRLQSLATAERERFCLLGFTPGYRRTERATLALFERHRTGRGREWFHDCREIRDHVALLPERCRPFGIVADPHPATPSPRATHAVIARRADFARALRSAEVIP